jgi:hypothetical protein
MDKTDSLLIVPMPDATQLAGILPKEGWEWLHSVSRAISGSFTQAPFPTIPPLPKLK